MIVNVALAGFALSGLCGVIRLLIGPGLADRIMAMDVTLMSLMGAIAVHAVMVDRSTNLVILVVVALLGFTATLAATRFLELNGGVGSDHAAR